MEASWCCCCIIHILLVLIVTSITTTSTNQPSPSPLKLSCDELVNSVRIERDLPTRGRVKKLSLGTMLINSKDDDANAKVVLSEPSDDGMRADFEHGMRKLIQFQGSGLVTQLIAYCHDDGAMKVCVVKSFFFFLYLFFFLLLARFTAS